MSTTNVIINQLNIASSVIAILIPLVSFVSGAIGSILNVLILTRPILRREPCTLYFLSSTCFNLFVICISVPVRTIETTLNIQMSNSNLGICKIETFAFYVARTISCWLIVCACIDRYLHSSANVTIRRLSSLKTARIAIGTISVAMTLLYSHMFIFYEISYTNNLFGQIVLSCNGQTGIYRTFIGFWYMTMYSLCPSVLMLFFGLLTLNNVRRRRQVLPIVLGANQINRRTDTQLLRMLITQVLITIIFTLPFSIFRIYGSLTGTIVKKPLRVAQENLALLIINTTSYFAHSSSFYLYTLTGAVFRKELVRIITRCFPHNRNRLLNTRHVRNNRVAVVELFHQ